jgi:hypothetical protein
MYCVDVFVLGDSSLKKKAKLDSAQSKRHSRNTFLGPPVSGESNLVWTMGQPPKSGLDDGPTTKVFIKQVCSMALNNPFSLDYFYILLAPDKV